MIPDNFIEILTNCFQQVDGLTDQDGLLTYEEIYDAIREGIVKPDYVMVLQNALDSDGDTDKDMKLSLEEFVSFLEKAKNKQG